MKTVEISQPALVWPGSYWCLAEGVTLGELLNSKASESSMDEESRAFARIDRIDTVERAN